RHHNLPEDQARRYFYQLVTAVQYLHALQIAHRDLKCDNILLTQDDKVKLTDFGFSRRCVDTAGKRILSKTYCGSAAYAAPEVLQGVPYNPKMYDVWSLGCILFIMLTGTMPFDDSNIKKMVKTQLHKRVRLPAGIAFILTKECEELLHHILQPDVTKRATVDQVLRHSWLQGAI
ncbi:testis-specific serine/threonine-protein kinase 1-like, partial [Limulus polyphemus]|uniref:Testis-specific serine/threonine-protein kinase 1-like n=1 Tax=Limulus polyphemus TaxID=6850 RepID=A0ABM1BC18_LIMPO